MDFGPAQLRQTVRSGVELCRFGDVVPFADSNRSELTCANRLRADPEHTSRDGEQNA